MNTSKTKKIFMFLIGAAIFSVPLFAELKDANKVDINVTEQKIAERYMPMDTLPEPPKKPQPKKPKPRERISERIEDDDFHPHMLLGDWVYKTHNKKVEVEFERDGEMEISVKDGFTREVKWEGFYKTTNSSIIFTAVVKKTESWKNGRKSKGKDRSNVEWKIQYRWENGKLVLSCKDFPPEIGRRISLNRDF